MNKWNEILDVIRAAFGKKDEFIPLHAPVFIGNEKNYLKDCIDSTFVSSVGKYVDQFELRMEQYTGAKKAVVCVNGTNALYLALKLVGVSSNTEVITQPLTFIATANAIAYLNANPIFLDVDRDTMGLSPGALQKWLSEYAKIQADGTCINKSSGKLITACVPMHSFGHPVKIDRIIEICEQYHIPVVEDAAESLGSLYKSKHTGTFGKIGILSFNGNKILTSGGGGMLLFNDELLAKRAKHLTTQAKVPHPWEFVHDEIGYNYRMPNINAAVGLAQLETLDQFLQKKRDLFSLYANSLSQQGYDLFKEPVYASSNYWLNCLVFSKTTDRDDFLKFSNENGIMTRPIWKLMNKLEMFKHSQTDALENAEWFEQRVVNIPSSVIL